MIDTAAEKGWDRLVDGSLMDQAELEGYEVMITTDRNIRHQQNMAGRRLAVVALLSQSWPYAYARIEEIRAAIATIRPGELKEVRIPMSGEA